MNDPDLEDILFDDEVIPDDDYIGVDNDEDEELGVDYMSMEGTPDEEKEIIPLTKSEIAEKLDRGEQLPRKRARIKKMPLGLLNKMPDVASMLITKANGRQVLFVNPKYYR